MSHSWSAGNCLRPAARTRHASRLVVTTSQPVSAGEVVDVVQVGEQAHPHRLHHILRIAGAQPGRPRDLPQHRAELRHDLAERVLAPVPGRLSRPAMRALRSGRARAGRQRTRSSIVDQPGQPRDVRAASARSVAACCPAGLSPGRTAGLSRPLQQRPDDRARPSAGPRTTCRSRWRTRRGSRRGRAPRGRPAATRPAGSRLAGCARTLTSGVRLPLTSSGRC